MAAASGALSALAAAGALGALDPGALGGALSADAGGAASPGGSPGPGAPKSWCFEAWHGARPYAILGSYHSGPSQSRTECQRRIKSTESSQT